MAKVGQSDLLARYRKVDFDSLKFITPPEKLQSLFSEASLEPENMKKAENDPNAIYISPTAAKKKKQIQQVKIGHSHQDHQNHEQRHKVYRPGPFALFVELEEGKLDKDAELWYYKQNKQAFGPISSYNMDKMVFFKTINDDTKVAYKSTEKFVKFRKIKAIVEDEKQE